MELLELYQLAEQEDIEVSGFRLPKKGMSFMDSDGYCAIALDHHRMNGQLDELLVLCHELGHCMTGSFYTISSPESWRRRCEADTKAWIINYLLPEEKIIKACREGNTEPWQLAEYFGLPQQLIEIAVDYYGLR